MEQTLPIYTTSITHSQHPVLKTLLLSPLHASAAPATTDPRPQGAVVHFHTNNPIHLLIACPATASPADPFILCNSCARCTPRYVPAVATGPEASPWVPG